MKRRLLRIAFIVAILLSVGVLAYGAATADRAGTASDVPDAPPRENATVATESARYGTIIAWHPNGSQLYYNDTHTKYFDVDPVEGEEMTVEYAATRTIHTEGPTCSEPPCSRNLIERVNLTTDETEVVYARYDPEESAAEWHDHERINDTHILVADMVHDQVFIVDTETELVEWLWDAQSEFPVEVGGPYPTDWVHLNDVDLLDDGRIMVSMRNQDQVVFVEPETGLQENWTLGADGEHDILYEQHNPDYIPETRGGPAVVVADSEGSRLVEYQRENGSWNQSWEWSDGRMQWPRDADRLPSGNTLATDTHGSRLAEIAPNGSVVWSVDLAHPYDVERLGTGEDSEGGESATRLGLESRTGGGDASDAGDGGFSLADLLPDGSDLLEQIFPNWVYNGLLYVSPIWMGKTQFYALGLLLVVVLAWPAMELRWRFPHLSLRVPVYRDDPVEPRTEDANDTTEKGE